MGWARRRRAEPRSPDQGVRRQPAPVADGHHRLYQTHWFDEETPIDETLRALDDLVRQGKVRTLGCSNYPAWRLAKALWTSDKLDLARYNSLQPHYSLIHRAEFERELKPLCEAEQIGVIPYSPLAGGFLTGKYRRDKMPDSQRAWNARRYLNDQGFAILDSLDAVAQRHGATTAQVALAWLLQQPVITSPIIGANSVEQLQELLKATTVTLNSEDIKELDEVSAWKEPL